ncbi:NlpC/P60 family protein [Myroides sp. JBRI-B21084]|uniref:C40 family peptidase n=1 Tax=Myroides sp. JBRI-B21084 TaxID=3119977 RepID=UPI0026E141A1|nr:NlpC/P60 family protein [Paenimyroides cloacae]WKW45790.1 NlpC/P60 family protein [Paenimyroides cloacae]
MMHNIQNRNFPVFFILKYTLFCCFALLIVSCKSKKNWTDSNKTNESKTIITIPKNTTDIAILLDVNEKSLKNKELYNFIINWYGTPYKFGGNSKNGIDCSGFTNVLYNEIYKIQLPRISRDIALNIKRKYTNELNEGDLVFFSIGNSGTINHVGIYLQNNKFVHASSSKGVIISNLNDTYYAKYLVKCGSYKK